MFFYKDLKSRYSARDVVLVILVIILSKSLYYETFGQNHLLILGLIIFFSLALLSNIKLNVWALAYVIFMMIIVCMNPDFKGSSIGVLVSRLFIGVVFVSLIDFRKFSLVFSDVILILGLISLLSFPVIYFKIPSLLPDFIGLDERPLRNFIFFGVSEGFISHGVYRISGLWWEPGAFQVFVGIAMFFSAINNNLSYSKIFLFFIIILSVSSSTGFILFFLLSYILILERNIRYSLIGLPFLIFIAYLFLPLIVNKVTDINSSYSILSRFYDIQISYEMFKENPFFGYGFGTQIEKAIPFGENLLGYATYHSLAKPTGSDGITMFVSQTGFMGIFLIIPLLFPKYLKDKKLILRIVFLIYLFIVFNAQNFTFTLIFILMSLYGVVGFRGKRLSAYQLSYEK